MSVATPRKKWRYKESDTHFRNKIYSYLARHPLDKTIPEHKHIKYTVLHLTYLWSQNFFFQFIYKHKPCLALFMFLISVKPWYRKDRRNLCFLDSFTSRSKWKAKMYIKLKKDVGISTNIIIDRNYHNKKGNVVQEKVIVNTRTLSDKKRKKGK